MDAELYKSSPMKHSKPVRTRVSPGRRRRILMLGWEFPPFITGGLGVACAGLIQGLTQRGHKVVLVLPRELAEIVPVPPRVQVVGVDCGKPAGSCYGGTPFNASVYTARTAPLSRAASGPDPAAYMHQLPTLAAKTKIDLLGKGGTWAYAPLSYAGRVGDHQVRGSSRGAQQIFTPPVYPSPGERTKNREVLNFLPDILDNYAASVERRCRQMQFDVIHCHDWITISAGQRLKNATGKPLIVHIHSLESDRAGMAANPVIQQVEQNGLHAADRVVAVSQVTGWQLGIDYGIPSVKIDVIHNAVNDVFDLPNPAIGGWLPQGGSSHRTVLFLGRFTWQKGPEIFIEAAAYILAKMPETRFIMIGDGDMYDEIVGLVHRLGFERSFSFPGFVSQSFVDQFLRQGDLLLLSSRREPFGLVALEAARAGIPVILPANTGVREVLSAAPVYSPGNAEDLARKALCLLQMDSKRCKSIAQNRQALRDLTWDRAAIRLEKTYCMARN